MSLYSNTSSWLKENVYALTPRVDVSLYSNTSSWLKKYVYALTPRVDVSLYQNTSSWLMPTSLCSYSTGRRVALLEHIIIIYAKQSILLLHG